MSKTIRKSATIKTLKGITISDPCYAPDVWCRYDCTDTLHKVGIDFAARVTDDEYPWTEFTLVIQPEEPERLIEIEGLEDLLAPRAYESTGHEVGMDSAEIYIGPYQKKGEWGCGLSTGTDGMFGTVYEFTYKNKWAGIALLAGFDADIQTPESVWDAILASFGATELRPSKKSSKAA